MLQLFMQYYVIIIFYDNKIFVRQTVNPTVNPTDVINLPEVRRKYLRSDICYMLGVDLSNKIFLTLCQFSLWGQ